MGPRRIAGIDFDAGQIEDARRSVAERKLENAEFFTASVYELPFPDASSDIVYSLTVLMFLREPVRALAETRRVLQPGLVATCRPMLLHLGVAGLGVAEGLIRA